jgi:hypothetical protein
MSLFDAQVLAVERRHVLGATEDRAGTGFSHTQPAEKGMVRA